MNKIQQHVERLVREKAIVPKPQSTETYRLVRIGKSRGARALVYELPKRPESKRVSTKRIPLPVIEECAHRLFCTGSIKRTWFAEHYPQLESDGTCNFTTVGGVLQLLGLARYSGLGEYATRGAHAVMLSRQGPKHCLRAWRSDSSNEPLDCSVGLVRLTQLLDRQRGRNC